MSRRFRDIAFKLHAWVGVHVFLFMTLLFATGTVLILMNEIEALARPAERLTPALEIEERVSFGTLFDEARAHAPDARVNWLQRADIAWMADKVSITGEDGERVLWFGESGTSVTREAEPARVFPAIRSFHDSFLTGRRLGAIATSSLSIFLLGLLIAGMVTYRRFWRGFLRLPPRHAGARGWWGGLHRLAGVWCLPFLTIIGLTGLMFLFDNLVQPPKRDFSDESFVERSAALPVGFDGSGLDRAVAAAKSALPELTVLFVGLPQNAGSAIEISGTDGTLLSEPHAASVIIDPATLKVLDTITPSDREGADALVHLAYALHFGNWGSFGLKLLWFVFGLAATVLSLSGAMVFASRTARHDHAESAGRRLWRASLLTKLGYPLFFIAICMVALLRLT